MYDLTSFLTTVAASSATMIAILGGFIASKLISISSDRASAIERMKQIEEELVVRNAERDQLQAENDADDAIDFISDHIKDLLSDSELDDVYDESSHPIIKKDVLSTYWERALSIWSQYQALLKEETFNYNEDSIPAPLAQKYADDEFGYSVCQKIGVEIKKIMDDYEREEKRKANWWLSMVDYPDIPDLNVPDWTILNGNMYAQNIQKISEHNSAITLLELRKAQLNDHINSLQKPKGMKLGLWIFAIFAICSVVLPLVFTPYTTENFQAYQTVKFVFLGLFVLGLAAIFVYLVYLLKWDNKI